MKEVSTTRSLMLSMRADPVLMVLRIIIAVHQLPRRVEKDGQPGSGPLFVKVNADLLHGSEYVLTYEDRDNDSMGVSSNSFMHLFSTSEAEQG
ncbi:hypothetical protein AHAS_Ahas14G0193000 [Arachis hypogaea]